MAFAAILGDGSVVTWGNADHGRDKRCAGRMCSRSKPVSWLLLPLLLVAMNLL